MEENNVKDKINEKHLEFLQANITRMNQCSFQMKGWAIAIVSALLAIYVSTVSEDTGNKLFIWISIAPTVLFWVLDAFYLSREYKFIGIYNDVAGITPVAERKNVKEFEMALNRYKGWKYSFFRAFLASVSTIGFYGLIIIGLILLGALL